MPYNHYNNDMPVPPRGYADWREVYKVLLRHLSNYEGALPPWDAEANFIGPEGDILSVEYWKAAHYAAREQAEEDASQKQLSTSDWYQLVSELKFNCYKLTGTTSALADWARQQFEASLEKDRIRRAR
jgi:hypothetical protein